MRILKSHPQQSRLEEWGNAIIHLLAAISSVAGLIALCVIASKSGGALKWLSSVVFGSSLIIMFSASTLYHLADNPHVKKRLKVFDHSAIFFLIAGTYTPIMLVSLHTPSAYVLLSIIWFLALLGTAYKCFFVYHFPKCSTFCYLLMGWLSIIAIKPLYQHLSHEGLYWLIAGGICYTVGVIFYLWKRLYFSHAVWHLFVVGGCACHFWTIFQYVLPY